VSDEPTVEQAWADLLEGTRAFQFLATGVLRRLDEEQAISDRCYGKRFAMGMFEATFRAAWCRRRGHRWHEVPKPITIRRWCARCYELEDHR
jgi:hypothetical protein